MKARSFEVQFQGKSWMDWFRGVLFGTFAIGSLAIGIAEIKGIADANGVIRHDAVIPCLLTAPILAGLSGMFIVQAIARSQPIIQICKEGLICRSVGERTGVWLPSKIAVMFDVFSGRGFRQTLYYFEWESLTAVTISGHPMNYRLIVQGDGIDHMGTTIATLTLHQHEFGMSIHAVADAVNRPIASPQLRHSFPSWQKFSVRGREM